MTAQFGIAGIEPAQLGANPGEAQLVGPALNLLFPFGHFFTPLNLGPAYNPG